MPISQLRNPSLFLRRIRFNRLQSRERYSKLSSKAWRKPKTIDIRARRSYRRILARRAGPKKNSLRRQFPILFRKLLYHNIKELEKLLLENIKLRVRIARVINERNRIIASMDISDSIPVNQ